MLKIQANLAQDKAKKTWLNKFNLTDSIMIERLMGEKKKSQP